MTAALLLALACHRAPAAPSAAASTCVVEPLGPEGSTDLIGLMRGVHDFTATGCSSEELAPHVSLPPALLVGARVVNLRSWANVDSYEQYLHLTGLPEDFDFAAVQAALTPETPEDEEPWGIATGTTYEVPATWPLHPDSPNVEDTHAPAWWTPPPSPSASLFRAQHPATFDMSYYQRARGMLLYRVGDELFFHDFSVQHLFPKGGIGG